MNKASIRIISYAIVLLSFAIGFFSGSLWASQEEVNQQQGNITQTQKQEPKMYQLPGCACDKDKSQKLNPEPMPN